MVCERNDTRTNKTPKGVFLRLGKGLGKVLGQRATIAPCSSKTGKRANTVFKAFHLYDHVDISPDSLTRHRPISGRLKRYPR